MTSRTLLLVTGVLLLPAGLSLLAACSDQTGPRAVDDIRLRPDSAHLEPGQTSVHQIVVLDEHDREMSAEWLPRIEWTLHTPELADMEVDGDELRVTAKREGTVGITAKLGSQSRSFQIFVQPPGLARIDVQPSPLAVGAGGSLWVKTRLYDVEGAEMDPRDFRMSWAIADTTLATIGPFPIDSEGRVRIVGNGAASGTGKTGKTLFLARVSGELATFDLLVTLEPSPLTEAPVVAPESTSSLKLFWQRYVAARSGYEVERATELEGPWGHLTFTGAKTFFASDDTTFVDKGLTPNSTYYYRVRPCNTHGCSVVPSPVGSGTTPAGN